MQTFLFCLVNFILSLFYLDVAQAANSTSSNPTSFYRNNPPKGALDIAIENDDAQKNQTNQPQNQANSTKVNSNFIIPPPPPSNRRPMPTKAPEIKRNEPSAQTSDAKSSSGPDLSFLSIPKTRAVKNKEVTVNQLLALDYDFARFPQEYYAKRFGKENLHLPPAYFDSYYTRLAFNAVAKEDLNALRFFIENYNALHKYNLDGDNLLIHAADLSKYNSARLLIEKKTNINYKNSYALTALHIAAIKGDYKMAKLLLSMGADFTIQDKDGKTSLDYAEYYDHKQIIWLFNEYFNAISPEKTNVTHKSKKKNKKKHHNINEKK